MKYNAEWISIKKQKPEFYDCGNKYLCAVLCSTGYIYEIAEWFDPEDGETEPFFNIETPYIQGHVLNREVTYWMKLPELP